MVQIALSPQQHSCCVVPMVFFGACEMEGHGARQEPVRRERPRTSSSNFTVGSVAVLFASAPKKSVMLATHSHHSFPSADQESRFTIAVPAMSLAAARRCPLLLEGRQLRAGQAKYSNSAIYFMKSEISRYLIQWYWHC